MLNQTDFHKFCSQSNKKKETAVHQRLSENCFLARKISNASFVGLQRAVSGRREPTLSGNLTMTPQNIPEYPRMHSHDKILQILRKDSH